MRTPIFDRRPVFVRVGRSALIDMLMAATESATVTPLMLEQSEAKAAALDRLQRRRPDLFRFPPMSLLFSRAGLPVAGILFGREVADETEVVFQVDRMFLASANRHDFGLWTSPHSQRVMAEVAQAVGFDLEVIGDFQSQPLLEKTTAEIELSRDYRWERETGTVPEFEGDRVSLLMTITGNSGTDPASPRASGSVVQLRIGARQIWLAAMLRHRRMPTQGPKLVVEPPHGAVNVGDTKAGL